MITIKSGRHPLAVTLLAFCAVSGVSNLIAYSKSATNVIRAFPEPFGLIYYGALTLGATLALVGVFRRGLAGPRMERSGLWMLAGLFGSYGIAAVAVAGLRALFFSLLLIGFAVGCLARIVQIRQEVKKVIAAAVVTDATDQLE